MAEEQYEVEDHESEQESQEIEEYEEYEEVEVFNPFLRKNVPNEWRIA